MSDIEQLNRMPLNEDRSCSREASPSTHCRATT